MESKPETLIGAPPRLITSVTAGFNTIANHVQLIFIPIVLDLFLWLGPHLRIQVPFQSLLDEWIRTVVQIGSADMVQMVVGNRKLFETTLTQFNLLSVVRTWPIGVPSLIAPLGAAKTPLGQAVVQDVLTLQAALLTWFGIILAGMLAGSLYFGAIAFFATDERPLLSPRRAIWNWIQTILLTLLLIVLLLATLVPALIILSIVALISPMVAQIMSLLLSFFLLWSLLPLIFSPHGIFTYGQTALVSLLTSTRLVRQFMPGTGLFLIVVILLSEGLDVVWRLAPPDSWMALVGIVGHAFITTGLMAASFIYYQGGMRWMRESILQKSTPATVA